MSRSIAVAVLLALVVSGCGDGEPTSDPGPSESVSETPEAHPLEGAWILSGRVTQSDFEDPGSAKVRERAMALTCLDDTCGSLLQRVSGEHGPVEWTVRIDGADMTGAHTRSGSCPSGKGEFTETVSWTWTKDGDALAGDAVQTFTGCKLDGTATFELTATAHEPASDLDHLDAEAASTVEKALDKYDKSSSGAFTAYRACDPQSWTCPQRAFRAWQSAADALDSALPGPADAPKACANGLEQVDTTQLSKALGRLVAAFGARSNARVRASRTAAYEAAGDTHLNLLEVARWCLPASTLAAMKVPPAYDTGSALPPMDQ